MQVLTPPIAAYFWMTSASKQTFLPYTAETYFYSFNWI